MEKYFFFFLTKSKRDFIQNYRMFRVTIFLRCGPKTIIFKKEKQYKVLLIIVVCSRNY